MKVVYTGEEMPETFNKSIFLCGPSSRPGQDIESWRNDAIKILEDIGFDGVVFSPEYKNIKSDPKSHDEFNYDNQVEWEEKYLNIADCILFWVPRDLSLDKKGNAKLPAFTTNIEWGTWAESGKVVFGYPEGAEKNRYMKHYADKYNVPFSNNLTETLRNALDKIGDGAERTAGERYVPLYIWNTDSFQSWYKSQKDAGNRLDKAQVLYTFRPRHKSFVFLWVLQVEVWIESEQRSKTNEFVLARTDISTVMLWKKSEPIENSEVVIIKEFRSPARTEDGFIRELAGGSSPKKGSDPLETAAEEIHEETGMYIKPERIEFHQARQLAGTLSSHQSFLYSVELTQEELDWFKAQDGIVHGKEEDTERTFIEIYSIKDLLDSKYTDWSTLGQVFAIINK